jgi:hypothetical protein
MASVLYYLGHHTISNYILDSRHEFIKDAKKRENDKLENLSVKEPSRKRKRYHHIILQKGRPEKWLRWDHFINLYMDRSRSQHRYISMAINSRFNVLKDITILKDDEFILSSLEASDGEINHVVCFTREFIFDSNAPHALKISKKSLDAICVNSFKQLHHGFYYHHRSKKEITHELELNRSC